MLLFTNIRTGFFKETEARSFTCQVQGQSCTAWRGGRTRKEGLPSWDPPHACTPTSSVMVAEKSIVWRWWEHIRMISFICSSKYSSSILEEGIDVLKSSSSVKNEGHGITQAKGVFGLMFTRSSLLPPPSYFASY